MESSRKMLVVLTTMVVTVHVVNASLVYVGGGKETWRPNVNFSEWSARQNIYVGDWLCKFHILFSSSIMLFSAKPFHVSVCT